MLPAPEAKRDDFLNINTSTLNIPCIYRITPYALFQSYQTGHAMNTVSLAKKNKPFGVLLNIFLFEK